MNQKANWSGNERRSQQFDYPPKTWWQGNNTKFWRSLVVILLTVTGFFLSQFYADYCNTKENMGAFAKQSDMHDLSTRVDEGFKVLQAKVDEINRYLRDKK